MKITRIIEGVLPDTVIMKTWKAQTDALTLTSISGQGLLSEIHKIISVAADLLSHPPANSSHLSYETINGVAT